jgi:hypothetical protein
MSRFVSRIAAAAVLGGSLLAAPARAADSTPPPVVPQKAPDWSGYSTVGELVGEVIKLDDAGFTLRVVWATATPSRSGRGRSSMRMGRSRNPLSMIRRMARNNSRPPKVQQHHEDLQFMFAEAGLVRWKSPPPKLDDNGKKIPYSPREQQALKQPPGVTGWAAERTDLQVGHVVEVFLVKPKSVPTSKATFSDLRVKYAIILGTDPNPPAVGGGAKKANAKKKK